MNQCKDCDYWEETDNFFHECKHPDVGDEMIFHQCWGEPNLLTNAEFGCILFKPKE